MNQPILSMQNISKFFGGHKAVNDITLDVHQGEIIGIIGPNGAGKSSFLNCIIGTYVPSQGHIFFQGKDITGWDTYKVIRLGMSRTFQVPRIFQESTLLENMLTPVLHLKNSQQELIDKAIYLLNSVNLGEKHAELAMELSGGQQKLLEFVRALMLDPKILLLDEPFAGVHPHLKEVMMEQIREIHKQGTSMLVVSHDLPSLYKLTRDIIVLSQGEMIARGNPEELQNNMTVVNAYFGR